MAIWRDYKYEVIFGIVLLVAILLSYGFAYLIPLSFYNQALNPILNGCIAMTCIFGLYLHIRHNEGIHVRILWACVLFFFAALFTMLLLNVLAFNEPLNTAETITLRGRELLIGNVFAWLLLHYPTAVLRPGYLNPKRALLTLAPIVGLAILDYLIPYDIRWVLAIYPVIVGAMLLYYHVRAYQRWCEDNYSTLEHIDARWIWRYMIMYFFTGIVYTVMSFDYSPAHAFTQQWLLLLMLGYSTEQILFRQDPFNLYARSKKAKEMHASIVTKTTSFSEELEITEEEEEEGLTPELTNADYAEQLKQWMETEKPYQDPEFRLIDIRQVLPLNRTYISQLINAEFNCTFYQFVTNYRIEEAKRLMKECPDMKMQDISEQCGFSSPTVFARIFSRETGMTPREWSNSTDNL